MIRGLCADKEVLYGGSYSDVMGDFMYRGPYDVQRGL